MSDTGNDFDAAKTISDLLKKLDKDRQQRVLRWVAESLDIALHVKPATPHDVTPAGTLGSFGSVAGTSPHVATGRAADIKSFVEAKNPKSDIQFAAVVAYYYRFEAPTNDRLDAISADALQNAARLTGRSRFAKPLVTLNNAKKQGYLDTAERGAFRINSVGENLVAMTLPGADDRTKPKPAKRMKSKKATAKPRKR